MYNFCLVLRLTLMNACGISKDLLNWKDKECNFCACKCNSVFSKTLALQIQSISKTSALYEDLTRVFKTADCVHCINDLNGFSLAERNSLWKETSAFLTCRKDCKKCWFFETKFSVYRFTHQYTSHLFSPGLEGVKNTTSATRVACRKKQLLPAPGRSSHSLPWAFPLFFFISFPLCFSLSI